MAFSSDRRMTFSDVILTPAEICRVPDLRVDHQRTGVIEGADDEAQAGPVKDVPTINREPGAVHDLVDAGPGLEQGVAPDAHREVARFLGPQVVLAVEPEPDHRPIGA